jgi:Rod binding domain-containing protein
MVAPLAMMALSAASSVVSGLVNSVTSSHSATQNAATKTADKTRKTSDDFEKMFLEKSLDQMTSSDTAEGPLGENGTGGGVYRSMLMKEYAGSIVKSGGVGISDQIYGQMLKLQEGANAAG